MAFKLLTKYQDDEWEFCDQADTREDIEYLRGEYQMAYGSDFKFIIIDSERARC